MDLLIPLIVATLCLAVGSILGYLARQSIAKKRIGTVEQKLQEKVSQAKKEAEIILSQAQDRASSIVSKAKTSENEVRDRLVRAENILLKRESLLDQKLSEHEKKENEFQQKAEKLKEVKENLEVLRQEALTNLEKVSHLSKEEAKQALLTGCEKEFEQELLAKTRKLEKEGQEAIENKAKAMIALAIQRYALSQAQEMTTTTVALPSDEIKGRIIGKEGRNIRALENLTGVEIVVDETPEAVVISGFDPIRRQIAKLTLEKLIQDGRIQPTRIEEIVKKTETEIVAQIKQAGETAVYDVGVIGLDPKLIQLLGRLKFRTSYGQNVLLHSIEVAHLAGGLAGELGANIALAKKAGLLHDIGKAMDQQVEGSHVDIGIKILEKFGVEKEVITAMKAHHEDYPAESLEATLVQAADQISGARPGARKDTLENYLKRLGELENIATSFGGVEKAYAIQAGREIRVFVKPTEIDDLSAHQLAKEIAKRIEDELSYPGEIKVNVIRESRVVEYAK
ncbi:MAG: ribonuclease Y [Candidatus Nealsonbacteria bacterium RIFCSPLOWO2_01_FULL_43_32]|uniref:Ribonuclease Y n=1 Tax=Candidatus Nealsonbacteria bacterium RIFCSPLOWO2_01_FULL_43_32 TaxID=1801672 RepID=A0A1G2EDN9_9BACT|nr:MAG: ribonuclease Y [Candidatus Nealsonbacteria bacterium RIFCSPLOWO2_01_FULL_43_32]